MKQKYMISALSVILMTGCGTSAAPSASMQNTETEEVINMDSVVAETAEPENNPEQIDSDENVVSGVPFYDIFTEDHVVNTDILDTYHHYIYLNENHIIMFYLDTRYGMDIHVITYDELGPKEEVFIVDMQSLKKDGNGYEAEVIYNQDGEDISDYFAAFNVSFGLGFVEIKLERNYDVSHGFITVSLIDGDYFFIEPFVRESYYNFLCTEAMIYYRSKNDVCPPDVSYYMNQDGTMSIHLFELLEDHTSTYAWYTVDLNGNGTDDITGEEIHLLDR